MDFIKTKTSVKISELFNKAHTENTLSASDCKDLIIKNNNCVILRNLTNKIILGKEIGSEQYLPKSDHRFLKTTNINRNFQIDEKNIEYCTPNIKANPKKNNILIVKDGGGDGLGEVSIYPYDNKNNKDSISAGIIAIELKENIRNYVFGVLKSNFFKNYIDLNTPQGSTIRHSKMVALNFNVPFPTHKNNEKPKLVEDFVSVLVQNIINKEEQIKEKNNFIDKKIKDSLGEYKNLPNEEKITISKLKNNNFKMDSGIYGELVKETDFLIKSNKKGFFVLSNYYNYSRGQNLQISQIGESIYSKTEINNFYKLVTNVEMQDDRTISGFRYLGNPNKLKILPKNSIMFAADGTVGRSFFFDDLGNTITNLHPWIITNKNEKDELYKTVYVSLFLSYLKNIGYLDKIKDKSNGGGLKGEHLDKWIKIPIFEKDIQILLAKNYYNPLTKNEELNFNNYIEKEFERNEKIGIYQLNMELFKLRTKLNEVVKNIVMNNPIDIDLNY